MRSHHVPRAVVSAVVFVLISACAEQHDLARQDQDWSSSAQSLIGIQRWQSLVHRHRERLQRWLRFLCTRRDGSFNCACSRWLALAPPAGMCSTGGGSDECAAGTDNCDENASCTDTDAGFSCACNPGYTGDGVECDLISPCTDGSANCSENATCTDSSDGFTCTCNPGYAGDGLTCVDVDECGDNPCDPNASCQNTPGDFACSCNAGFSGNGLTCSDVNECAQNSDNCSASGTCTNTPGSFSCACNAGFAGDGVTCTAIDQCANNDCDENAVCQATAGGFTCTCIAGYTGDGRSCSDVNECAQNSDNCSANATCTNTPGGFSCACNAGYSGNGVSCSDVNECAQNSDNCSANATCTNTPGGFSCACNAGYSGDGVTCTPVVQSCNLTGTFAALNEMDLEWDPVLFGSTVVIAGGSATVFSYSIQRLTQSGNTIAVESTACGGTSPDVCSPLFMQAFGQSIPDSVWELPSMPVDSYNVTLANAPDPGDPFVGPTVASLVGLDLANPAGAWPVSYTDPAITWLDHDADGQPGVTSFMISGGTSPACNLPYGNLPIPATGALASRIYTGTRSLGNVDGTIDDCNTISGAVAGPSNGLPLLNGHVIGCLKDTGQACTAAETQSLDEGGNGAGQRILRTSFVMVRASDTITCAQARAMNFP